MAVDELVLGRRPSTRRRRQFPGARFGRALIAFVATVVALFAITVLTSRGWSEGAALPPVGARQPAVPFAWDLHLPYARVDQSAAVVSSGGRRLEGRVFAPRGAPGTLPAVALVGSTGEDLQAEAEAFARGGVVALVVDSTPNHRLPSLRTDDQSAGDALAAADLVAGRPGVDPHRVGLVGFDEGGRVVAQAAERGAGRVGFVVLASTPVVSPAEQRAWRTDRVLGPAPALLHRVAAVAIAGAYGRAGDADTAGALARAEVPVYAVWGAADPTVPVAAAVTRLQATSGDRLTVEIVAQAGHRPPPVTDGWTDHVSDWIRRGRPADPVVRGVEPVVSAGLPTLPTLWPLGDLRVMVGLGAVAGVAAGVRAAGRVLRRRRGPYASRPVP